MHRKKFNINKVVHVDGRISKRLRLRRKRFVQNKYPSKSPPKSSSKSPSKPPSKSPSSTPSKSPSKPPSKSPSKPPSKSPLKSCLKPPTQFVRKKKRNKNKKRPRVLVWSAKPVTSITPHVTPHVKPHAKPQPLSGSSNPNNPQFGTNQSRLRRYWGKIDEQMKQKDKQIESQERERSRLQSKYEELEINHKRKLEECKEKDEQIENLRKKVKQANRSRLLVARNFELVRKDIMGELVVKKEKVDGLEEAQFCLICMDQRKNIKFVPCKHVVCCEECAKEYMEVCPVCRRDIRGKELVYV